GYDEFILEKGNVQYLRDEVAAFNNFYSTVDRYQERVVAYLLANAVSMNNPFFIEWNIRPDEGLEFQPRQMVTMKDGS
ncbi:phage DNA encapsidation protein, partial [Alkalihalophilus lindianensis]